MGKLHGFPMDSIGKEVVDAIIAGKLVRAECVDDRVAPCILVWSANVHEQISHAVATAIEETAKDRRGIWVEFARDGRKVVDIIHEPKDAEMPDKYVWCEEPT